MSGTERVKIYYWDSCIYLAWLLEELVHGKACLDAIMQVADDNKNDKNTIVTSTIVFTEVLAAKIGTTKEELFRKSFRGQTHIAYDVDAATALKARAFREAFLSNPSGKLPTPDAIHLATASICKADEFWTLDDGQKGKNVSLLSLDRDARVDGLTICKPSVPQASLGLPSN